MTNSQKSQELEERTLELSKSVISLCRKHKNDKILQPVAVQLVRSATSIGANYAEANNASSKADFKNKIYIAKKEAAETRYWLRLLLDSVGEKKEVHSLINEASELLFIFQKITSTLRNAK